MLWFALLDNTIGCGPAAFAGLNALHPTAALAASGQHPAWVPVRQAGIVAVDDDAFGEAAPGCADPTLAAQVRPVRPPDTGDPRLARPKWRRVAA